jgi:hypothetical protein
MLNNISKIKNRITNKQFSAKNSMLGKFFWNVNMTTTENVFSCVSKRSVAVNVLSLVNVA